MIYRTFQDLQLSALGFGTMRLPVIDGDASRIDEPAVREMVAYAMEHGVNYYDTAYGYHGGQSEVVTGRVLRDYPRERYFLATKFPSYNPDNVRAEKGEPIFEEQLAKCGVDYFDFYLCHNINSANIEPYLSDEGEKLFEYLLAQKENGRIRHLGFSVHGDYDIARRFLEKYGQYMEFGQIQLNWIDYEHQEARRKVELFSEFHIPIWVMEPLRGGRLAVLAPKYTEKLASMRPDESVPGWAFRFLQTVPRVGVILSGMSDMQQLIDNIDIFATEQPLTVPEWEGLMQLAEEMENDMTVPCTACRYCVDFCPQDLDIPNLIAEFNDNALTGKKMAIPAWMLGSIPEEKQPSACLACRSCEKVCPQGIKISEVMRRFAESIVDE